jgi:DUF4097 and DUF4098 domain-containing protein YvlB
MISTLVVLTAAVMAGTHTDTTVTVKPGTRLELNNFGGSIEVTTWSRNSVRVSAEHSSRVTIDVEANDPTLEIKASHRHGIPTSVDYQITVPKWMGLDLSGVSTDMSVENSEGEISVQSVQGEISVMGGTKKVTANTVEGEVRIEGASGRIECSSVNGAVHIVRSTGPVAASSVNGEIVLDGIDSDDVEASTVNGTVSFEGAIKSSGSYRFSTHNGDVDVTVPERVNATVSVATFSGEFSSGFPIQLSETKRGKRFNFTLGSGDARIEMESFQGGIRLHRPGRGETKSGYKYEYKTEHKKSSSTKTKDKNSGDKESEP